jgi:23S rRNA (uracil1939-C5)-methyltransferase
MNFPSHEMEEANAKQARMETPADGGAGHAAKAIEGSVAPRIAMGVEGGCDARGGQSQESSVEARTCQGVEGGVGARDERGAACGAGLARIEKWVYGGAGLARVEGQVAMIQRVAPGELVRIEVERRKPGFVEARAVEIVERAAERIEPECPYFERCGGCHYQHTPYAYQLERKVEILREVFARVGKMRAPAEIDVISGEPWEYRNRSQFHFAKGECGYRAASSHELVPVARCPISAPKINEALATVRRLMKDRRWPRFVVSLELFTNGEQVMVNVLETQGGKRVAKMFFDWIAESIPGAEMGSLECAAAGEIFRVSHGSFFQVNRFLTDALCEKALEGVEGERALDLYAGVGLFTIPLARRFLRVTGVESNTAAALDLAANAERANVGLEALRLQAEQYLEGLNRAPDFVLADPPRSGLGKHVVKRLLQLAPRKLTIVSCDPATLARDVAALAGGGYSVESMTLIDLFPQTYHIETVTRLVR